MALEHAYGHEIQNPALKAMLGSDPENVDKQTIQNTMRKEEFQRNCLDRVMEILANQRTIESAQSSAQIFIGTARWIAPSVPDTYNEVPPDDLVPEVEDDF